MDKLKKDQAKAWVRLYRAAEAELQKGNVQNTQSILNSLVEHEDVECRVKSKRLLGISYLREKSFMKAKGYFYDLVQETGSLNDYMSLLAAAHQSSDLQTVKFAFEGAFHLAEEILAKKHVPEFTPVNILFYYLEALVDFEDYKETEDIISNILQVYRTFKSLDEALMFTNGIPSFSDYLALVAKYYRKSDRNSDFVIWLKLQKSWVDPIGDEILQRYLDFSESN